MRNWAGWRALRDRLTRERGVRRQTRRHRMQRTKAITERAQTGIARRRAQHRKGPGDRAASRETIRRYGRGEGRELRRRKAVKRAWVPQRSRGRMGRRVWLRAGRRVMVAALENGEKAVHVIGGEVHVCGGCGWTGEDWERVGWGGELLGSGVSVCVTRVVRGRGGGDRGRGGCLFEGARRFGGWRRELVGGGGRGRTNRCVLEIRGMRGGAWVAFLALFGMFWGAGVSCGWLL